MTTHATALRVVLECLANGRVSPVDQPELIAKLASAFPHSIAPAPPLLTPVDSIASYNCFEFALGMTGRREVALIAKFLPSTLCASEFAAHLVESILVPVAPATNQDLVLYHDGQQYTHAGLVHDNRILSKWGNGLLWLHSTLEVPANYGSTTSYYRTTNPEVVLAKFLEFARKREGITLVNDVLTFDSSQIQQLKPNL